ncbi:MAG: transcriptional regulator, TetR family [Clostridiaceae bacterium]|nr:transcriptional regulator, TetR family [Clostridiaceae bacterium]
MKVDFLNLKDKIKEVAMITFNEKGFEGATIRDICKKAGVTAPSIYLRYGSKENLYVEIFNECRDSYYKYLKNIINKNRGKSIEEQLFQIFKERVTYYLKYKENYKFYFRAYSFPAEVIKNKLCIKSNFNYLLSFENTAEIFVQGIKERVIKEMDVEKLLKICCSIIQGYMFQLISFDEMPKEEDILTLWQVFWTGIKY